MLTRAHVVPNIAVKDLEKARRFYGDVLGLKETAADAESIQYGSEDGTKLCVYKKEETKPADSTRLTTARVIRRPAFTMFSPVLGSLISDIAR